MFILKLRTFSFPSGCTRSLWMLGIISWLIFSCSVSRVTAQKNIPSKNPVEFTEEERLDYEHDFIEATKLKLFGDLATAASQLTRCTEVNPYDAAAYFQLSEIYTMIDDRVNALKNARLSVAYDTGNVWYKMQLANLYILAEDMDSAINVFRDITDMEPDNVDLQFNLALLYSEAGHNKKALKELKKIEKSYGFTEDVAIAYYQVYSKKEDVKATEKLLLKGIDKYPDDLRFYGLLAELYSSVGKEKEAQENYKKLLDVDPENALGYISMIEFYKDYGNDDKVIEEMRRMYGLKTIDPDLKVELFLSLTMMDTVFANKYSRELDDMVEGLFNRYPDNFRVRMINADRNLRKKDFQAAKDDLLFITDRIPTNVFLWEQLLFLLNLLQDNEMMFEASAKALKYFENNYLFNFFHGLSASMLKKFDDAIGSYNQALENLKKEKEPDKAIELQIYVLLGEAYNEQKNYAKSDEVFEKALIMAPNNPLVLNNYSYYLSLREEKLDLAEKYIKKCIALEPNSST
ncbi:MAG: tetratricopeptide repeat protein, partial [Bacteroidales bacterium]|nr:tetratricopeptide repeat protein [Bacteroidales bacterium]